MKCRICVNNIENGEKFCTNCGSAVPNSSSVCACRECGKELYPGDNFCTECGEPKCSLDNDITESSAQKERFVSMLGNVAAKKNPSNCSSCNEIIEFGEKFCTNCGKVVTEILNSLENCPTCGTLLEPGDKYCIECGEAIPVQDAKENSAAPLMSCIDSESQDEKVMLPVAQPVVSAVTSPVQVSDIVPKLVKVVDVVASTSIKHVDVDESLSHIDKKAEKSKVISVGEDKKSFISPLQNEVVTNPAMVCSQEDNKNGDKKSSNSIIYGIIGVAVIGIAVAFFAGKNSSSKIEPNLVQPSPTLAVVAPSSAPVVIVPPVEVSAVSAISDESINNENLTIQNQEPTVPIRATGITLVSAVSQGAIESDLTAIMAELKQNPKPSQGDRKLARRLNEEAIKILHSAPTQAIDLLERAQEADKSDSEVADNLGFALRLAGRYKDSEFQLIRVLGQWPERSPAWANLAETSSNLGNSKQAVAAYLMAYKISKSPDRTLSSIKKMSESAKSEQVRGDMEEAIRQINTFK